MLKQDEHIFKNKIRVYR